MIRISLLILGLSTIFATTACSHSPTSKSEVSKIELVGEILPSFTAARYSDIYFSGQPPVDQLSALKKQGFASIVNLRAAREKGYDAKVEAKMAKASGLNYVNIPVKGAGPLTDETISQITSAVVKNRKMGKTLVHCSSGNRAALWAGGHFYKDHGVSKTDAVAIAERIGLSKDGPKKALAQYLKSKPE